MDTYAASGPTVFDPFTAEFQANPFPILRRLREEDPIHGSAVGWLLTRYDGVRRVDGR